MTKPVFGVSDKARLKPVSSAAETSLNGESLLVHVASFDMIHVVYNTRITKAGLRLCRSQISEDKFSRVEAHLLVDHLYKISLVTVCVFF